MKEALVLIMLALLIGPLLLAVRRIRRLPPRGAAGPSDAGPSPSSRSGNGLDASRRRG